MSAIPPPNKKNKSVKHSGPCVKAGGFSIKAVGFDLLSSEICSSWLDSKEHLSDFFSSSRSKGRSASIL